MGPASWPLSLWRILPAKGVSVGEALGHTRSLMLTMQVLVNMSFCMLFVCSVTSVVWVAEVSHSVIASYVTDTQFKLWTTRRGLVSLVGNASHVLPHIIAGRRWHCPFDFTGRGKMEECTWLLLDSALCTFLLAGFNLFSFPVTNHRWQQSFSAFWGPTGNHWAWGWSWEALSQEVMWLVLAMQIVVAIQGIQRTHLALNQVFYLCQLSVGNSTILPFYVLSLSFSEGHFCNMQKGEKKNPVFLFFRQQ